MKNETRLIYKNQLPDLHKIRLAGPYKNFVIIYDEKLKINLPFKLWLKNYKNTYSVAAGEKLKCIDQFSSHVKNILPMLAGFSPQENIIVAIGGGSVGDFAGFMASVLKRGVGYVAMPTTWLSAVDSAHGGKTALNVNDIKNQVGTFYPAQQIIFVKDLLFAQPDENLRSAFGEVIKMALITGGVLYKKVQRIQRLDHLSMWKLLPTVVQSKMRIVKKDPLEKSGYRHLLNFGHTFGHVIELETKLPHGIAVQIGVQFAAAWSLRKKLLKEKDFHQITKICLFNSLAPQLPKISATKMSYILKQDKKTRAGEQIRFIFLKKPGRPVIQNVPIEDMVSFATDAGWAT